MTDVEGTWDDAFGDVAEALAGMLAAGDTGGSAAVFVDGEPVADVRGGSADAARGSGWRADTVTNVWSVTKTMTALTVLLLADRGELDLDAPVARYWPEFAACGKHGVLVRHLLGHTAGVPDWEGPVDELYDWDAATARIAALPPQWEPGTAAGYHSLTFGFGLGEVVRRVTGRTIGEVFAEQVAGPFRADFHLGLAAEHEHRVAPAVPPPGEDEDYATRAPGDDAPDAAATAIRVRDGNSRAWLGAQIPAASGVGNARSVALVQSVLACGGAVGGVRLLSEAGCRRAAEVQFDGDDLRLGMPVRWGLGYGLMGGMLGWGGWGGSLVMVDPEQRMAVAFVTNQMREPADDRRGLELVTAAYTGLSNR